MPRVSAAHLERDVAALFERSGLLPNAASTMARHLIESERAGVATHGVTRVPLYLDKLASREIDPDAQVRITSVAPALFWVDAGGGYGQVAGYAALARLADAAEQFGIAAAVIANAGHFGALRVYVADAIARGKAMLLTQFTPPNMGLTGLGKALIGNNPLAFGIGDADGPLIVDLAMSVAARGKLLHAAKRGDPIPDGWAVDAFGKPTNDAERALDGTILALGGIKGIALALFGEIFAGILSGATAAKRPAPPAGTRRAASSGIGAFMIVLDVTRFVPAEALHERLASWRRAFLERAAGAVHLPGTVRCGEEIELTPELWTELRAIAARLGIARAFEETRS